MCLLTSLNNKRITCIYLYSATSTVHYILPLLSRQISEEPLYVPNVILQHESAMWFRH